VISIWTKEYNLLKTQIMSGHRFVSSAENYKKNDLTTLQKDLEDFHPIQ
jgi:hypothetical protein